MAFEVGQQIVRRFAFYVLQGVFDVSVRIQSVDDCGPIDREQLLIYLPLRMGLYFIEPLFLWLFLSMEKCKMPI